MIKTISFIAFLFMGIAIGNAQQNNTLSINERVSSSGHTGVSGSNVVLQRSQQNNYVINSTPIWGAGAAVGASDGEFANGFVSATSYSAGDNVNSWTALSVFDTNGNNTPGAAYWTRNTLGYSQGAYWGGTTSVGSNSAANGVAIFDSDLMDNGGTQGAFGLGTSPSPHKGELISPRIDLTGYSNTALSINFFSFYRDFNTTERSVSISTDDGTSWTTVDYTALSNDQTEETVAVVFATATSGLSNLTQCRIKFTLHGDYYFSIIDDVVIEESIAKDLTIGVINDTQSGTFIQRGDQVHITGNRYFPLNEISQNGGHISFGANVLNNGFETVTVAEAPTLNLLIEINDATNGWTSVHTQSIVATQDIAFGAGVSLTGLLDDTSWMTIGSYRATYTTSFTGTDGDTTNNSVSHLFDLTANTYASKVGLTVSGDPLSDRMIFPGGGPYSSYEYGSVFNLDNSAGSTGLDINEIKFNYRLANGFTGASTQTLFVKIYAVNDVNTNGVIDGSSELNQVGLSVASLSGLGTTITPGTYYTASVSSFVNAGTGAPLGTLPSGKYFISIEINPALTGGVGTFGVNDVPWFGASEVKDYNMNLGLITNPSAYVFNPSALNLIDAAGSSSFLFQGFGPDVVPSIGVSFTPSFTTTVSDGDFSNTGTWINGILPTGSEPVVINHNVTIPSDMTLNVATSINNSKSLTIEPGATLTLGNSIDNSNGGDLIFKSDAAGVGQLLLNAGATINGPATVERFVPALDNTRRAFRFITSSVNSTGSIYENWQESGNSPTGLGTHITGSMTGANGFDATATGNPSMFTYEHLLDSWQAVPNTDMDVLSAGKAYRILVRGDRNFDLTNSVQQPVNSNVTLRAKGNLILGDVNLLGNVVGGIDAGAISRQAGDFSFIGNPYQAIVDFESLPKSNVNPNFMYIWNPNLSTSGLYETVDVSGALDSRQFIQPGQAFFVLTDTNGDASLLFNEAAKSPTQFSNTVFSTPTDPYSIDLVLSDNANLILDRFNLKFDDQNIINNLDAPKLFNQYESLSSLTQSGNYSIEHRELPQDNEVLQLQLIGHNRSDYQLTLDVNLPQGYHAVLVDNYLNSSTIMSSGTNAYSFDVINSQPASSDINRFQIRFEVDQTLSVSEINVTVFPNPSQNGQLNINSSLFQEEDVQVKMINMLGQVILTKDYNRSGQGQITVNTSDFPEGAYILTLSSNTFNVSKKVILK